MTEPRVTACEVCGHTCDRKNNTCFGCGHVVCVRHFPSEPQHLGRHGLELHHLPEMQRLGA